MPTLRSIYGNGPVDFVGFDFEKGYWNIGLLGEWYTHTVYMPLGSFLVFDDAMIRYREASALRTCGVRPVFSYGDLEIEPFDMFDCCKTNPPCCEDGYCILCSEQDKIKREEFNQYLNDNPPPNTIEPWWNNPFSEN